jgi:hypothetical protein
VERLGAGLVAALGGGGIGVLLARFVWEFAGAKVECDLAPGGRCPGPDRFLPFGLIGGSVGALTTLLAMIAVVRSLD